MSNATSGKGASVAFTSSNSSPTLRYIPSVAFSPLTVRGDSVIPLLNNAYYASNKCKGASFSRIDMITPFIAGVMNADYFARLIGSTSGDSETANYHKLSLYPDAVGTSPDTYQKIKAGAWQMAAQYGSGAGSSMMIGQTWSMISIDPENGTALAAPSAGALSTSPLLSLAQCAYSGVSDVVAWNVQCGTGLQIVGPTVAGNNSNYPYLPTSLIQTDILGQVSVTQKKTAGTVLGADGSDGTLTISIGAVSAGVAFTFMLSPISIAKPTNMGVNYMVSTYQLKSTDGTAPIVFANM